MRILPVLPVVSEVGRQTGVLIDCDTFVRCVWHRLLVDLHDSVLPQIFCDLINDKHLYLTTITPPNRPKTCKSPSTVTTTIATRNIFFKVRSLTTSSTTYKARATRIISTINAVMLTVISTSLAASCRLSRPFRKRAGWPDLQEISNYH